MTYKYNTKAELLEFAMTQWNEANAYIDNKMQGQPIPFYTSVDIRESHNKFAPVDNNIYPAGFNNLCNLDLEAAARTIKEFIQNLAPGAKSIGVIPESHTKNLFYLDHLAILGRTIRDSGFEVYFLSPDKELFNDSDVQELVSHSGYDIVLNKFNVQDGKILAGNDPVDLIVLNNDQSSPLDINWQQLPVPVVPTPLIGWYQRSKVAHFQQYKIAVEDFCKHFSINPSLLQARFVNADKVDFSSKEGMEELGQQVDQLISELPQGSKVFIKGSQGTYGMGISVVSSGKEVIEMNRKARKKMDVGKSGIKFTSLIVQEGIETVLNYEGAPAEVTIYLVGGKSIGGFMRANTEKDSNANLNAKGMVFRKFCISEIRANQDYCMTEALYSLIARISTLASSYEIKNVL